MAKLRSLLARPGDESSCHWFNRLTITWHTYGQATIPMLSFFRARRVLTAPARFSISSETLSFLLVLSNRADTKQGVKGRSQARETSEISFHSLRHSAVTMLKASGVSDVLAREIVGHESAAVSRHYTHLTTADLRSAMQRLPEVTNA